MYGDSFIFSTAAVNNATSAADVTAATRLQNFKILYNAEVRGLAHAALQSKAHLLRQQVMGGKGHEFNFAGTVTGGHFTLGKIVEPGGMLPFSRRQIFVDDEYGFYTPIPYEEVWRNNFDERASIQREAAYDLARYQDLRAWMAAIKGANASADVTGGQSGTVLYNATAKDVPEQLVETLKALAIAWSNKGVPEYDRHVYILPETYTALATYLPILSREVGGAASISTGIINDLLGFSIHKCLNLPSGYNNGLLSSKMASLLNTSGATYPTETASDVCKGWRNDYRGDYTKVFLLAVQGKNIGQVWTHDIQTEFVEGDVAVLQRGKGILFSEKSGYGYGNPACLAVGYAEAAPVDPIEIIDPGTGGGTGGGTDPYIPPVTPTTYSAYGYVDVQGAWVDHSYNPGYYNAQTSLWVPDSTKTSYGYIDSMGVWQDQGTVRGYYDCMSGTGGAWVVSNTIPTTGITSGGYVDAEGTWHDQSMNPGYYSVLNHAWQSSSMKTVYGYVDNSGYWISFGASPGYYSEQAGAWINGAY